MGHVAVVRGGPATAWSGSATRPARKPVAHPAMGGFQHEAACVDAVARQVYLSEDVDGGGLYRFTPTVYPDLSAGVLEIACAGVGDAVVWKPVPDPEPPGAGTPTRSQVADSIKFRARRGHLVRQRLRLPRHHHRRDVHVYDTNAATLGIVYKAADVPGTPLLGIDNILATRVRRPHGRRGLLQQRPGRDGRLPDHAEPRGLAVPEDHRRRPLQPEPVRGRLDRDEPGRHAMYVASQRYKGTGQSVRDHAARSAGSGDGLPGHPGAHAHAGGDRVADPHADPSPTPIPRRRRSPRRASRSASR